MLQGEPHTQQLTYTGSKERQGKWEGGREETEKEARGRRERVWVNKSKFQWRASRAPPIKLKNEKKKKG